jgi:hypothetical protein
MPQTRTLARNAPTAKRGISAGMVKRQDTTRQIDVTLDDGVMVMLCKDLSVGNVRAFTRAQRTDDADLVITAFMDIVADWRTYDDDGNVVPIPDEHGDPWPMTEENLNSLDWEVFQKFGDALGKQVS